MLEKPVGKKVHVGKNQLEKKCMLEKVQVGKSSACWKKLETSSNTAFSNMHFFQLALFQLALFKTDFFVNYRSKQWLKPLNLLVKPISDHISTIAMALVQSAEFRQKSSFNPRKRFYFRYQQVQFRDMAQNANFSIIVSHFRCLNFGSQK